MKSRSSIVAASVVLAVLSGGVGAYAASPANDTMARSPATCVSHHPEWSDVEAEAMQSGNIDHTMSVMGSPMGSMASMMGGSVGHMGWGR